jgi:HlyD family secretion protein
MLNGTAAAPRSLIRRLTRGRALWVVAGIAVAALAMALWLNSGGSGTEARYRTAVVDRGGIVQQVSANGTLNPVVLVNVGTQVSGTINKLYADYNDAVRAGQVLARLDPALLEAQLAQSRAALAKAEADLKLAEANAKRSRFLFDKQMVSEAAIDQAEQALAAARAQAALAGAQVQRDRTNLEYSVIRSPVSGVVVARDVDVGQTVAASFQTPTLFKIAQDLGQMQIDTSVAEADIGGLKVGQPVRFSVDAYPDREFQGEVRQIRLNPTIEQNVVTYNVVVAVDNRERLLMPGMTANVRVVVAERPDALRVPNAALRFQPAEAANGDSGQRRGPRPGNTVYKLEGGRAVAVPIGPGITDNRYTEVVSGALASGDVLILEDREVRKKGDQRGAFRVRMF